MACKCWHVPHCFLSYHLCLISLLLTSKSFYQWHWTCRVLQTHHDFSLFLTQCLVNYPFLYLHSSNSSLVERPQLRQIPFREAFPEKLHWGLPFPATQHGLLKSPLAVPIRPTRPWGDALCPVCHDMPISKPGMERVICDHQSNAWWAFPESSLSFFTLTVSRELPNDPSNGSPAGIPSCQRELHFLTLRSLTSAEGFILLSKTFSFKL